MTDALLKPTYSIVRDRDSWGYIREYLLKRTLSKETDTIFSAGVEGMGTCAWSEVCYFKFYEGHEKEKVEWSEELQAAFWRYIKKLLIDNDHFGGLVMMNLNKSLTAKNPKQPEWFVKCLDNSPQLIWKGDWYTNKNHSPVNSKVCLYLFRL